MNIRNEVTKRLKEYPLYAQEGLDDPIVSCKLFAIAGAATWYLTEWDGVDVCFGYVTGLGHNEWGYVSLGELEALRYGCIPLIECDIHFTPCPFSSLRKDGAL